MFDEDVFFYKSRKNLVVVSEDFLYCSYQGNELHRALELLQRRWSKSFIVINLDGVHQIRLPEVLWKVPSLNLRNPKENITWRNWLVKEINEEAEKTSESDKQHLENVQFPAIRPPATNLDSYLVVWKHLLVFNENHCAIDIIILNFLVVIFGTHVIYDVTISPNSCAAEFRLTYSTRKTIWWMRWLVWSVGTEGGHCQGFITCSVVLLRPSNTGLDSVERRDGQNVFFFFRSLIVSNENLFITGSFYDG